MKKILLTLLFTFSVIYSQNVLAADQEEMARRLSPDQDQLLTKELRAGRDENIADEAQINRYNIEQKAILNAPVFDKAVYLAKQQQIQELHTKIQWNAAHHLAEALSRLSPESRHAMANRIIIALPPK